MWWKVYSWITICVLGLGLFVYIWYLREWTVYDWATFISGALAIFILYSHLYNPKSLSQDIWKVIFWINLATTVISLVLVVSPLRETWLTSSLPSTNEMSTNEYIFISIIMLPILFANYQLGYTKVKKAN